MKLKWLKEHYYWSFTDASAHTSTPENTAFDVVFEADRRIRGLSPRDLKRSGNGLETSRNVLLGALTMPAEVSQSFSKRSTS
jgi:hypothetical protein